MSRYHRHLARTRAIQRWRREVRQQERGGMPRRFAEAKVRRRMLVDWWTADLEDALTRMRQTLWGPGGEGGLGTHDPS